MNGHLTRARHGSLETFGGPQRHAIAHLKAGKMVIPNIYYWPGRRNYLETRFAKLTEVRVRSTRTGVKFCKPSFQIISSGWGQGPIIQVWPSGQITLTGDVIGSMGGAEVSKMFPTCRGGPRCRVRCLTAFGRCLGWKLRDFWTMTKFGKLTENVKKKTGFGLKTGEVCGRTWPTKNIR